MAGSINKVILVGNVCADPETKTMQSGDRLVNLTVATIVSSDMASCNLKDD